MSQLPNSELPMSQPQNQLQMQPNFNERGKRYFRDFTPGDDFYEALIDTHRDLTDEQSALVNAKLILLLANMWATCMCCAKPWLWRVLMWPR
jgi:hypothetical protein